MSKVWVEQLPSGNYSARFRHPVTNRKERAGAFADKNEALAAARKAVREIKRLFDGDPEVSRVSGAPTLAEYAAEAIDALPHVRPSTRKRYHSQARQLVKFLGDHIRVDQLRESTARAVVAEANRAGMSHSTCEGRVTVLGHIVDQAHREGYTSERSVDWDVPLPSQVHHQRALLLDDTVGLITCAMPYHLWVGVLLSRDTGLRISEVVGLRVQDVDLVRRRIRLVGSFDPDGVWREHTTGHRAGIEIPLSQRLTAGMEHHFRPPTLVRRAPATPGRHRRPDGRIQPARRRVPETSPVHRRRAASGVANARRRFRRGRPHARVPLVRMLRPP